MTNKKTILILGGYGFLGTNIMKYVDAHLLSEYNFIVFDKFERHLGGVDFKSIIKTYSGDFTDTILLKQVFVENKIDIVIHSLSTTVPVNSFNAKYDIESNLLPTIEVLNLMVENKIRHIVYISSGGAIYGINGTNNHKESDDVFPISSYGVVKLTIEKYLMQYAELYGIKPLILRLSNPYGPYHYSMKQGVINVALTNAVKRSTMQIWGDGNGRKDYIYVEDFVDILFMLIKKQIWGRVVNIGKGETLSVNEIISAIKEYEPHFEVEYQDAQKFDVSHFALDLEVLKSLIGDYKCTELREGLQKTYNWTKTL